MPRDTMPHESFDHPRDTGKTPFTIRAADGKTTLYRYRVDAVIYAPNRTTAHQRLDESSIYLDRAEITGSDPRV